MIEMGQQLTDSLSQESMSELFVKKCGYIYCCFVKNPAISKGIHVNGNFV